MLPFGTAKETRKNHHLYNIQFKKVFSDDFRSALDVFIFGKCYIFPATTCFKIETKELYQYHKFNTAQIFVCLYYLKRDNQICELL